MRRNKNTAPQTETRKARRDRAQILVRLDQVIPEVRAEIEREWDRRERKAAELRNIKGNAGRTDANAFPTEGQTMTGSMVRAKKDSGSTSDVQPGKHRRNIGAEVVRPDEDDTTVSDGLTDDRSEIGQFVPGPETEQVDVGGVPTQRRRR